MRCIEIDGEETRYFIDREGRLLNKETNHYYKGSIRLGYRWYDLRWRGKKRSFSAHRLVGLYYIPNPKNLPCVRHIDGNRLNNRMENLEWSSWSDNNLKRNKKESGIDHSWEKNEFLEEIWRPYKDTVYQVSNYGRLRNTKTDRLLKGKITGAGYREYSIINHGKRVSITAHRMVCEMWLNHDRNSGLVINHKDGDKLNNFIDNLEIVTHKENLLHKLYVLENHSYKKVGQFDQDQNLIQIFPTCASAAREMKVAPQSINRAIHEKGISQGFFWRYLEEE